MEEGQLDKDMMNAFIFKLFFVNKYITVNIRNVKIVEVNLSPSYFIAIFERKEEYINMNRFS
jgi:hypothetical protein